MNHHSLTQQRSAFRRTALALALLLMVTWIGTPPALADGTPVPSGCDKTLDVGFYGTCQTAKYSAYGYYRSGLTAWVQATLDGHGYTLDIDGKFGSITDSKVRSWQTARGLTADGIVGNNTWQTLDPFGGDPRWVFITGVCDATTGLKYYRTNGIGTTRYAAVSCWFPDGVGSGIHYLATNDLCVLTTWYGYMVPANDHDPRDWGYYGDCRDFYSY